MASATFGRRNAIKSSGAIRPPAVAESRRSGAECITPEAEARAGEAVRAIDPARTRKIVVGMLALVLIAVALPLGFFSELRRDTALQDTFRADMSVRVERASCSRYFFLVTSCSVHLSWPEGNARRTAESSFLVGLKSMGGLRVMPARSTADSSVVTTAVALEHVSNRIRTMVLLPGTCLLLGVLMLLKLNRGRT
jgi:hypothetical protein